MSPLNSVRSHFNVIFSHLIVIMSLFRFRIDPSYSSITTNAIILTSVLLLKQTLWMCLIFLQTTLYNDCEQIIILHQQIIRADWLWTNSTCGVFKLCLWRQLLLLSTTFFDHSSSFDLVNLFTHLCGSSCSNISLYESLLSYAHQISSDRSVGIISLWINSPELCHSLPSLTRQIT